MRKIRVICSDPYATDCSSDDEESTENKRTTNGKLFVQEISIFTPTIHQDSLTKQRSDATDSSSREDEPAKDNPICINQELNSTVTENHRILGRAKRPGIQMTELGKWGAYTYDPIEGTLIWLGSYNTIEEATNVYNNKKLEFALLRELINQQNRSSNHNKRQRFVLDGLTIFETVTGKWAAWTRDPISNVKIWVGVYITPEEAVESYCRRKLDFDSNSNSLDIVSPIDTDVASFKRPGTKMTKTGRWGVTIHHPSLKSQLWLGSLDTIQEAAEFYDKKKKELDAGSGSHDDYNIAGSTEVVNTTVVIDSQGKRLPYKGIRLRASGRWSAEIRDPFNKGKRIHLGTFDTPEEANDVYSKRKLELDEMASHGQKKQKSKGVNPEAGDGDDVVVVNKEEPNNASLSDSTVTGVSSQNSEGSNNNDRQISGLPLAAEDEFGFGVINCYGELVGEFSRIDDELWLTGIGDYDEYDVNGAIGVTQDHFALDYKPFP